jgi:nucleoside phosphorylase
MSGGTEKYVPRGPCTVIYRGTIASGKLVVKDAVLRDILAKEYDLLCFEIEVAGALADFPCIVICGISDYCDSHKNDRTDTRRQERQHMQDSFSFTCQSIK